MTVFFPFSNKFTAPFCIEECRLPNTDYSNFDVYKVYLFMLKVDKIINQESFNCWSAEQGDDISPRRKSGGIRNFSKLFLKTGYIQIYEEI